MAIANTIIRRTVIGNLRLVLGKSVLSDGTNTGDVETGLSRVEHFNIETSGSAQKGTSVNETLPLSSGDVTIVSESNDATVYWMALGR